MTRMEGQLRTNRGKIVELYERILRKLLRQGVGKRLRFRLLPGERVGQGCGSLHVLPHRAVQNLLDGLAGERGVSKESFTKCGLSFVACGSFLLILRQCYRRSALRKFARFRLTSIIRVRAGLE